MDSGMIAAVSTTITLLITTGYGMYRYGKKKGLREGKEVYKQDIFVNGVRYKSLSELEDYAEKLREEGYTDDFPMIIFSTEEDLL